MFKKVLREIDVFDVDKLKPGTKIKYISCDEDYKYFNAITDEYVYDWGYGNIISVAEDEIRIHYYSEIESDYDRYEEKETKRFMLAWLTPRMIIEEGYILEEITE